MSIRCFAKNSAFAAFYGLLVTHLVAYRLTLGNPVLVIPIMYLLSLYRSEYGCVLCENKVYAVLSENVACCNLRVFWVK